MIITADLSENTYTEGIPGLYLSCASGIYSALVPWNAFQEGTAVSENGILVSFSGDGAAVIPPEISGAASLTFAGNAGLYGIAVPRGFAAAKECFSDLPGLGWISFPDGMPDHGIFGQGLPPVSGLLRGFAGHPDARCILFGGASPDSVLFSPEVSDFSSLLKHASF